MKLGIITAEIDSRSGWAQYSLELIAALREHGVDLTIVASKSAAAADFAILPPLAESRPGLVLSLLRSHGAARSALATCDVVHTFVEPFAPLGVRAAGARPHVLTAHGTYAALPSMRRWPIGALYRRAFERSTVACISSHTQDVLRQHAPGARSVVIPNGVNAQAWQDAAQGVTPFEKHGPILLFVGAVKRRKGILPLIRAMPAVLKRVPNATCVVVGSLTSEPETGSEAGRLVDELGLADRVRLMGHVAHADLLRWYKTADVFVMPSMNDGPRFEGYGLVYLEAASLGVPSIGTWECGARDAIDHETTGLLVSQARVDEELPAAIVSLLSDPDRLRAMGAAALKKANRSTWRDAASRYVALYESVLEGAP
ncbi:MAG: glycosyltransferase family 4 protein [Chloroflexi bacterium]|nr:glycosyltransferase family 4 protein [Chloroflexota bacterium]